MSSSSKPEKSTNFRATCTGCRNYFVTYDPTFPYGCQLFGFKSRQSPRMEVRSATGHDCTEYAPREKSG